MNEPDVQFSIRMPSYEEQKLAYERYALAVGKVVHSWNFLHERLGQLFHAVMGGEMRPVMAVWYSVPNDRNQRTMLLEASKVKSDWPKPTGGKSGYDYAEEIKWLLIEVQALGVKRDNAIHAPVSLYIGTSQQEPTEMGPWHVFGHPKAKALLGQKLIEEFLRYETIAEMLSKHCDAISAAIKFPLTNGIPQKPLLPTRGQKTAAEVQRQSKSRK